MLNDSRANEYALLDRIVRHIWFGESVAVINNKNCGGGKIADIGFLTLHLRRDQERTALHRLSVWHQSDWEIVLRVNTLGLVRNHMLSGARELDKVIIPLMAKAGRAPPKTEPPKIEDSLITSDMEIVEGAQALLRDLIYMKMVLS